jgi:CBS domain-containing protein
MSLETLLKSKANGVLTVNIGVSVLDAICAMCDHKVGSLLVEDTSGEIAGIVTERDILRFCGAQKGTLAGTNISEAMTTEMVVATPEMSIEEAMTLMTEHSFRHLPVMANGKAIGMTSLRDLVKARLDDVEVEAQYLRDYINS